MLGSTYSRENGWESFIKIQKIGTGVYGKVYKAKDRETGDFVAVKKTPLDVEGIPATTVREIMILKLISGHDNIVKLLGTMRHEPKRGLQPSLFMVMEYMDTDLYNFMKGPGVTMSSQDKQYFVWQILHGVKYCHELRVCHRDLKPSNILVNPVNGTVKIADFGLSRLLSTPAAPISPETVTQIYRAPEIFYGAPVYGRPVDIWSVGCIFAELYRTRPLFYTQDTSSLAITNEIQQKLGDPRPEDLGYKHRTMSSVVNPNPPVPLSTYVPGLDADGVELLSQMLLYNPFTRITAAKALEHRIFNK